MRAMGDPTLLVDVAKPTPGGADWTALSLDLI